MSPKPEKKQEIRAADEARRDEILRRMLNTPPKPKKGKGAGASTDKPQSRPPKR